MGAEPISAARQMQDTFGSETVHAFLRRSTSNWHGRVERAFARFDIAQLEGLRGFLAAQAAAVLPLESELERRGVNDLLPDWAQRKRSAALLGDLTSLGVPVPELAAVALPPRYHVLGVLYVLEGSRLGGELLRRRVAASDDPIVRTTLRFLGHKAGPRSWTVFLRTLDSVALAEPDDADALKDGAALSFAAFYAAACGFSVATAFGTA